MENDLQTAEKPQSGLYIPLEIHERILPYLDHPRLAVYARLSTSLHSLATPLLYKELVVDPNSGRHPFSALLGSHKDAPQSPLSHLRYPDPSYNRFAFTTHLTVLQHLSEGCVPIRSFDMPNLVTLLIGYKAYFCAKKDTTAPDCCPIIRDLRPRHLVLGNGNARLAPIVPGLYVNSFPPPGLRRLTFYLGDGDVAEWWERDFFLGYLPGSLERATIIIQPRAETWYPSSWAFDGYGEMEFEPHHLVSRLAAMCAGGAKRVEIVGLEMIDEEWLDMSLENLIALIRRACDQDMEYLGRSEVDRTRRLAEEVVFLGRVEYDERERESRVGSDG